MFLISCPRHLFVGGFFLRLYKLKKQSLSRARICFIERFLLSTPIYHLKKNFCSRGYKSPLGIFLLSLFFKSHSEKIGVAFLLNFKKCIYLLCFFLYSLSDCIKNSFSSLVMAIVKRSVRSVLGVF